MTILIKDIMSENLITIHESDSVLILMEILNHAHISGLPVLNQNSEIVGIVSKTDLSDHLIQHFIQHDNLSELKVKDLLTTHEIITVHQQKTVVSVANTMRTKKIHRVLVVNDEDEVVGIVTTFDVTQAVSNMTDLIQLTVEYHESTALPERKFETVPEPSRNELDCYYESLSVPDTNQARKTSKVKPNLYEIPKPELPHPLQVLSARELQILAMIADNYRNVEIMNALGLSEDWLNGYIANILSKLCLENEVQAVQRALDTGIIEHAPLLEDEMLC